MCTMGGPGDYMSRYGLVTEYRSYCVSLKHIEVIIHAI